MNGFNYQCIEGLDYSKLENARKLMQMNILLIHNWDTSRFNSVANDEVIAVAYQYTVGDQVYQVGEFGNDGVESTVVDAATNIPVTQCLILKMLKSNLTNVEKPIWNLMMKNIYQIPGSISAYSRRFQV
jgi:cell surface protein SprA